VQNDLWALYPPARLLWRESADLDFFNDVYDWDTLELIPGSPSQLAISIQLCTSLFPCRLSIEGLKQTPLVRYSSGNIVCQVQIGCSGVKVIVCAVRLA
jgi:hypothetical protein